MSARQVLVNGPWPSQFDLNVGEAARLHAPEGDVVVTLRAVGHDTEPDFWTGVSPNNAIYVAADVRVEIDGEPMTLTCRPGERPTTIGQVRLYVETTRDWARSPSQFRPISGVDQAVRFSAAPADATWGPGDLVFPIGNYRWRSSTYQNTWGAQVPFNTYYYHRGEDLGAVPDRLPVLAVADATVRKSPEPGQPVDSNYVLLDVGHGVAVRYAHMNIDTIRPHIRPHQRLDRGSPIGLTGQTCDGSKSQHDDPHLHVDVFRGGSPISPYPMYLESYFRTYTDTVLAMAGGFGYTLTGHTYRLDGTRSVARPGTAIVDYEWHLHDGQVVHGPITNVVYGKPGYFAEELVVRTADGGEDRDAISVVVYEPTVRSDVPRGWVHYSPPRAIHPGTPVEFWSRLRDVVGTAIEFGDGTTADIAPNGGITHSYDRAGLYVATVHGVGLRGEHVSLKVRVRVES
ncbi:Murein DD-endopeptidase MepM and murein hydrolase activator NlpD, contain LysM domain [Jiangella sp. DSM 45060]|nr:Murein DD-endopeptidase MepM and murein hydrolase activator NlpD, contain LysM domain [Jiangella sp. DSM 45060]